MSQTISNGQLTQKDAQPHQSGDSKWYYYKTTRIAKITKTKDVGKDMEQGKFPYAAGGSILVQLLWKTV